MPRPDRVSVPERVRLAVEALEIAPGDRVLEFGCGPGVSVELVCARLGPGGFVAAVDRSSTAVARTLSRVSACVDAGRAAVCQTAFTAAGLAGCGLAATPYDKIFSINVNLYWTGSAEAELALARSLLAPGGRLYAFYEAPGGRTPDIAVRVAETFRAGGFAPTVTTDGVLCVSGI
jgi:cyclopropane fatty-acyl-phospholipid synthase-like methyltransferase